MIRITVVVPLGISVPERVSFSPIADDPELRTNRYSLLREHANGAIEMGLQLRESRPETKLTLLCVGPPTDVNTIRDILWSAYDEARVLVTEDEDWRDCSRFASVVLPEFERDVCNVILVQASVAHAAQHLSARLGFNCLPSAKSAQWCKDQLGDVLEIRTNDDVRLPAQTPCVISVVPSDHAPRYANLKQIIAGKRKPFQTRVVERGLVANHCDLPPCGRIYASPGSLAERYRDYQHIWPPDMAGTYVPLAAKQSLLRQISGLNLELDQRLTKAVHAAGDWASYVRGELEAEKLGAGEDDHWIYSWTLDPTGASMTYIQFNPNKGVGEIRDNDVVAFLLGHEPSILRKLTSAITAPVHRSAFEAWMLRNSKEMDSLAPCEDYKNELAADTTARVFGRAAYYARLRRDPTLRWQDVLRFAVEVGTTLGEDLDHRPLLIDSLMEMITRKWNHTVNDTPEVAQILAEIGSVIPEFDGDFQYVMVLEGDKVTLGVCSHVGDFVQSGGRNLYTPHRGLLRHYDDNYWDFCTDGLAELNELLRDQKAAEVEFQKFFQKYPDYFRKFDVRQVYPIVHLTTDRGDELVPDFLLINQAVQKAMIVELKLPTAKLVIHRDNRVRFAHAVMEARAQLLTYRRWFENEQNRDRLTSAIGMPIYQPRLAVIIGRASEFYDPVERQALAADTPDIEVVTYDDMVAFAEEYRSHVRTIWMKASHRPKN